MADVTTDLIKIHNQPKTKRLDVDNIDVQLINITRAKYGIRDEVTILNEGADIQIAFKNDNLATDYTTVKSDTGVKYGAEYFESLVDSVFSLKIQSLGTSTIVIIY